MKQARILPVRSLATSQWTKRRGIRLLSSTAARLQVTPHEQPRPPASHPPASTSHEQQASRAKWTRERASTAEHPEGDGSFSGQGSMIDTALGIALGTAMLGCGGIAYFQWYKWNVLRKMEIAFRGGYDPVMELEKASQAPAAHKSTTLEGKKQENRDKDQEERIRRREQHMIDKIMKGEEKGHYYLILGPKGSGKTSMMIQAMIEIDAEGIAMLECHEDPEVFRTRFGKAINFEYHEDSYNGLFQRRDPKEAGPLLDIERAMSKLEKVAIRYRKRTGKPLILVFNNVHFLKDDDVGDGILHLIQQRAESWAASQCANIVFNSDDFRIYDKLKKNANRMEVLAVRDLNEQEAVQLIRQARRRLFGKMMLTDEAKEIYQLVGGRPSVISSLAKRRDMLAAAKDRVEQEKQWLLSKIGLIPDHDDDVMDEQKWSSCSWLLLQELAKQAEESDDPKVTWAKARDVMTRPDFINDLDHLNIIQIDTHYNVRPDSRLLLNVCKEVVSEEDFQERLDTTRERIDAIESLHRTRELTLKDPPDAENVFKIMLAPSPRKGWFRE